MKLVVQCSCLNEEETLPVVLKDIPKHIPGIDRIEVVIVDDGSTDNTMAVAKKHGVKHIVRHPSRQGLARGFRDAIEKSLEIGADIIVHTDGDNQYPGERIPDLVAPILAGKADIVIADRQVQDIAHFSPVKKWFQKAGTLILNLAAGTKVPDAPSGFRAYSKEAAIRLNVVTRFSYAMETIIQAGNKQLHIESIAITTNPKTRESRLFKSSWEHIYKSASAIIRAFIMYKPYVFFLALALVLFVLGLVPFGRFLYLVSAGGEEGARHIQSLIAGSVLLIGSFLMVAIGVVADLIRINRVLIEDSLEHSKRLRFTKKENQ
ncbi:MAG TPA: glycosyltransferase family 2 protein [Candidatus Saccharimonadales bacterium]|nr:glycosyltransferase family 2 protein [Candidatus Saccharimonadales bacterium]